MNDAHVLVHGMPHVYQFEQNRSKYRCEAAVLAAVSAFARPNHWPNLSVLMHEIYIKYVQGPNAGQDSDANTWGLNKDNALDWLRGNGIGYYDLQHIVDTSDSELLRHHMGAMNESGIPVILGIDDESHLYQAKQAADGSWTQGPKMHNWNDAGLKHALLRVGMSEVHPVTLINDPAAACPPFEYPTPVLWSDLQACGINTAIGIMPPGVPAPDASFSFYDNGVKHAWPVPKPHVDLDAAASTLHAIIAAAEQMASVAATLKSASNNALSDIGK